MATLTDQHTITLFRGFASTPNYIWSPFVMKLETRFRIAGLAYKKDVGSPFKGPKGKIPYIVITSPDSADSPISFGDSALIISKFIDDGVMEDINAKLSPAEKAQDLALRSLMEDKLYWYQNYERWYDNYYTMRSHVLSSLSYPLQVIIGQLAYREHVRRLDGQGTARYSGKEIAMFRNEVWESIGALLAASRTEAGGGNRALLGAWRKRTF